MDKMITKDKLAKKIWIYLKTGIIMKGVILNKEIMMMLSREIMIPMGVKMITIIEKAMIDKMTGETEVVIKTIIEIIEII